MGLFSGRWRSTGDKKSKKEQEIRILTISGITICIFGVINYISERNSQDGHRSAWPSTDGKYLRTVKGKKVKGTNNPGIRIESKFLSDTEGEELFQELRTLMTEQGFNQINDDLKERFENEQEYLNSKLEPNHLRLTGRPEMNGQKCAVWGYANNFDRTKLTPNLRKFLERVEKTRGYKLGKIRDVTINYRKNGWHRIDPHVDPLKDGPNNFVLSLGSDSVLTLIPPSTKFSKDQAHIAENSFTGRDIDILNEKNSMLFLFGNARFRCPHGIRNGVIHPETGQMCDWFGGKDNLIPRGDERISVVLAFGPHRKWGKLQWEQYVKDLRLAELPKEMQGRRPFSTSIVRPARRFLRFLR